jgi:hypothetical protein
MNGELPGSKATIRVALPAALSARETPTTIPATPTPPQKVLISVPAWASSSRPMPA